MTTIPERSEASTAHLRPTDVSESLVTYVRHAWRRRHFAYAMPLERLRSRHQHTVLGNVWNLLNPMLTAVVYFLIFSVVLNASRGVDNYILWLVIGLFAFRLTSASVSRGATSVTGRQGLVRSIKFPRVLLPVSTTIGVFLSFGFEVLILLLVAVVTGEGLSWRVVVLPGVIALHFCFNLGLAMVVARLNDSFRDVEQLIPFGIILLRYVCGVMIPISRFEGAAPTAVFYALEWNPLVQIIDLYRWVLMDSQPRLSMFDLSHAVVVAIVVLLAGLKFFSSAEHRYGRP